MEIVELSDVYYNWFVNYLSIRWDMTKEESMGYVDRWIKREDKSICFIGLINNDPMAFGVFDTVHEEFSDLSPWCIALWVKPEFRGNGYGFMLSEKRFEYAISLGYKEIYLDTYMAKDYHKKMGWMELERRIGKYIESLTIMKRPLISINIHG